MLNSYWPCQIISEILTLALSVLFQLLTHKQQNLESVKKVVIVKFCWNGMVWAGIPHQDNLLCSKHYLIVIIRVKSFYNTQWVKLTW